MNVVINALSAKGGGGQFYLENLFKHFDESTNLKVWIVCPDTLKIPKKTNIERIIVKWPTNNPFLRLPWEVFCLPRVLKELKADILFCPGGFLNTRVPRWCKSIITFQNLMAFDKKERCRYPKLKSKVKYWLFEKLFKRSILKAGAVIFISDFSKKIIQEHVKLDFKKSIVIHHGLSEAFKRRSDKPLPKPSWLPKREYLLYVSAFRGFYKNHIELLQGFSLLKKRRNTKEVLVFLGNHDNIYGQAVKKEIERLGLIKDVFLYDEVPWDDIPAVYHHAKINVFASSCETCSNIVLEALASSRPLLLSRVPPMPEFGRDAVVYFDPLNPEDIAEKISSVIDDEEYINLLSQKAFTQSKEYNWKETADKTWGFIANSEQV